MEYNSREKRMVYKGITAGFIGATIGARYVIGDLFNTNGELSTWISTSTIALPISAYFASLGGLVGSCFANRNMNRRRIDSKLARAQFIYEHQRKNRGVGIGPLEEELMRALRK
jgi:hypothetical protein